MNSSANTHELFMRIAVQEAHKGFEEGNPPIGACVVKDGVIVSRGHNRRVSEGSQILHGEMDALKHRGDYKGATLYTTLYPCSMCAGAAARFGIAMIVVGEARTFFDEISETILKMAGIEVINLDLEEPRLVLDMFIKTHRKVWDEDIGK